MKTARAWTRLAAISMAAIVTAGVAGCGEAEFTYVRDRDGTTYFKVPASFAKIDSSRIDSLLSGDHPDSAIAALRRQRVWSTAFDQAAQPDVNHLISSGDPFVYSTVHQLTPVQRDSVSLDAMRDFILPVTKQRRDAYVMQVAQAGQRPLLGGFVMVSDQPIQLGDGARGVRIRFEYQVGRDVQTFDQTAYLNKTGETVSVLLIRCPSACFAKRGAEFDRIAESFKLLRTPG
ncbi:hypothetical protein [Nonomuraea sp. NPDC046570]|uniref:hypothetical protein n=1 Tax=Nonomuraea sp. NPDC046570 TaxID=3155255 RepID=UPI0033DB2BEB